MYFCSMRLKQGDTMRDEICNLRLIFGSWRIRTADLTLDLPLALAGCEFLIESSHFNSRQNSAPGYHTEDCDAFRFCPYVVKKEGGLVGGHAGR
jgi:hypothetical protein